MDLISLLPFVCINGSAMLIFLYVLVVVVLLISDESAIIATIVALFFANPVVVGNLLRLLWLQISKSLTAFVMLALQS